jgi:hypothetical protein
MEPGAYYQPPPLLPQGVPEGPFVLVFDVESTGQESFNPDVSVGAALVDSWGRIAITDGEPSVFEVFLPMEGWQSVDPEVVNKFWMKEENIAQYEQWLAFNHSNPPSLTEQMKKFVEFCDKVCKGRWVEKFVDTAMFDVTRLSGLLDRTQWWEGKPKSWSYLLKDFTGERYYSEVLDIKSFYYAWSHLSPNKRLWAAKQPGGIRQFLRQMYGIPPLEQQAFKNDHYASHDAAFSAANFTQIRRWCEKW